MWSKVKVKFSTLSLKSCGHDTDYSFSPITFKLHMQVVHDERRNPIDFGLQGQGQQVYKTLLARYRLVFVQSLLNFTCKLFMMRRGNILILGHRFKFQGQLWPREGMQRFALSVISCRYV